MKNLKHIKLYENFISESIFDKIESAVKGKTEKGKIVSELLKKYGIGQVGTAYSVLYLGGANPGKVEMSHPFDYIQYTPGVAKISDSGTLELIDEKSKKLKVPDTISFLSVVNKEDIVRNWIFGLKPCSSVNKNEYKIDLSKEIPTITMSTSMWSIPKQNWISSDEKVTELDEDISEYTEEDVIAFKTPINIITLQEWVNKLNATGWVKDDTDYFKRYIK